MRCEIILTGIGCAIFFAAAIICETCDWSYAAEMATETQNAQMSPALIREIQFMLLRLGMDPGPIDGVVGPQTNRAVHEFQRQAGLPIADLVNVGTMPMSLLSRLRDQAAKAMFPGHAAATSAPAPGSAAPPSSAAAPVAPAPMPAKPAPDRFAACPYNPEDFRIGETQYTPERFLRIGFGGSTARAVTSLKERLDEARQLAKNIGGPALAEVQRQARVLHYFDCRLKIEQADNTK